MATFRKHKKSSIYMALLAFVLCGVFSSGCKPLRRYAMGQMADIIADSTQGFHSDNDPELIRESLPFALKLIEGTISETPNHKKLLLQACSGFTEYAWGFLRQDADEIEDDDYEEAETIRLRCKKMLLRARGYGLRGLEVSHPDFEQKLRKCPQKAVACLHKEDAGFVYWLGACWGAAISLDKNDTTLLDEQNIVDALIKHALELDDTYEDGAIHDLMITYSMARAMICKNPLEKAKYHFKKAVEISDGNRASPYLNYAESISLQKQNRKEFIAMLKKALAVDVDKRPEARVANLVMKRRAKWLMSRVDDLFLK